MGKFSREERLNASKKAFSESQRKGGSSYLIPQSDAEEQFDVKYFRPQEGPIYIAILPRVEAPEFFMQVWVHTGIGPSKDAFICPSKMNGDPCPICDHARELQDSGEDYDIFKSYLPKKRYLMWVVNMDTSRTIKDGPQLYEVGSTIIKGISGAIVDERTGELIYDVTEDPINIQFKRTGTNLNTDYGGFKPENREKDIPDDYYDLPPINELLVLDPDPKEMARCVGGSSDDDADEPARGSRRGGSYRRNAPDDDDEKPSRRGGRATSQEPDKDDETSSRRRSRGESSDDDTKKSGSHARPRSTGEADPLEFLPKDDGSDEADADDDTPPARNRGGRERGREEGGRSERGGRERESSRDRGASRGGRERGRR